MKKKRNRGNWKKSDFIDPHHAGWGRFGRREILLTPTTRGGG
jgi:hypothetical protein